MQPLENTDGLMGYGAFIALALLVAWAMLLVPLSLARLQTRAFLAASGGLAFFIVFFWLWPTITEISIWKFGSIKTNVEQARVYLNQLKAIEAEVGDIKAKIEADAASAEELQKRTAKMQADFNAAQTARQPRHITPEQQSRIVELLKAAPKGTVFVASAVFDMTDAKDFATQISDTLKKAGYDVRSPPKDYITFSMPGAFMFVRDINNAPLRASAIQKAFLEGMGLLLTGYSKPDEVPDADTLIIAVSAHPP